MIQNIRKYPLLHLLRNFVTLEDHGVLDPLFDETEAIATAKAMLNNINEDKWKMPHKRRLMKQAWWLNGKQANKLDFGM